MYMKVNCMNCDKTYVVNLNKPNSFCTTVCREKFYDKYPLLKEANKNQESVN